MKATENCNIIFRTFCPQAITDYPIHIDKYSCRRLLAYEKCAISLKHECAEIFHLYALIFCSYGHADAINCQIMYRSVCSEAVNQYPLVYPDNFRCQRIKLFQECAVSFKDKHCVETFQKTYKVECPYKDTRIKIVQ
eukprot:XP_014777710.1 PREDICTED: uncharacterized protein LOC106874482 [Octopus bimaculoides]